MSAPQQQYRERFLANMLTDVLADQLELRAGLLESCAPRAGDFNGRATEQDLAERTARCQQTAEALRAKAYVLRRYGVPDFIAAEVSTVLGEVA